MCFLEPQILEPAVCFQRRPDAFTILNLEKPIMSCDGQDLQSLMGMEPLPVFMCNNRDFTEHIVSEITSKKNQEAEDFQRLSTEQVNGEWLAL